MQQLALYYPTMKPPAGPWLMRVLLYWDQVATIVPRNVRCDLLQDPYMKELHEAGLLVMLDPERTVHESGAHGLVIEALETMCNNLRLGPSSQWSWERIHTDKFSHSMLRQLRSRKLIDGSQAPNGWLNMERSTAQIYMGLLAGMASGVHSRHQLDSKMVAVTDTQTSLKQLPRGGPRNQRTERYHLRVLDNILPFPAGMVPAAEIRRFKDENRESLIRLRSHVEERSFMANQLAGEELEAWLDSQREDYNRAVADLSRAMACSRWSKIGFAGFGTVLASGLGVAGDVVSGADALSMGLMIGSGVLGLGVAGSALVERIREPNYDTRAPLAYAALAQRKWPQPKRLT